MIFLESVAIIKQEMSKLPEKLIDSKTVSDYEGKEYILHSHTSHGQCKFLQKLIGDVDARICLEIGLAYGISALYICEAINQKSGSVFYSIDVFQEKHWNNIGLKNIEEAGYRSLVKFYEDYAHKVLPRLLDAGVKIDFAYVDGGKLFDVICVNGYYLNQLLRNGGIMVFDDCTFPGIKKCMRLMSKLPNLVIYDKYDEYRCSAFLRVLSKICNRLPYKNKLLSQRVLKPEDTIGINAQCIAFQKISEDIRKYDWHEEF